MRLALVALALLLAGPPLAYFALRGNIALSRHDFAEMDWNGDGWVTPSEAVAGSDIGRRPLALEGRACVESFAFKDGSPIRTDCPG